MSDDTSTTWGSWRDRATYLLAEAQLLLLGLFISVGIALIWLRPTFPGVPPIVVGWVAATLLLGPPLFGFFVWLVKRLRRRNMIEVFHVDAVADELKKYYIEPEVWAEKSVEGPNPYPVNGGASWAVQEFEWLDDLEELTVKGVWLEETQDVKLITDKNHMRAIYGKLTESHIALKVFRDSVSEFGADIQGRLINSMAEARERGKMMDKSAIEDVFDQFQDEATDYGPDDLPTLDAEHMDVSEEMDQLAAEAVEDVDPPETATTNGHEIPAND